jgi:hypothetical protein
MWHRQSVLSFMSATILSLLYACTCLWHIKRGGVLHRPSLDLFDKIQWQPACDLWMLEWYPGVVRGTSVVYGEVYQIDEAIIELLLGSSRR